MKKTALILIVVGLTGLVVFSQTGKSKHSTPVTKKESVVKTKPEPTKKTIKEPAKIANTSRDGVVYQRTFKNQAVKQQVEKKFGEKAGKNYVGQTTQARLEKRQAEHAKKLGLKKNDVKMEIIGKNASRRTLRAVEQGFINKKGGIDNLANKRNPVARQKWEKHLQEIRTQNLRERKLRELNKRPF